MLRRGVSKRTLRCAQKLITFFMFAQKLITFIMLAQKLITFIMLCTAPDGDGACRAVAVGRGCGTIRGGEGHRGRRAAADDDDHRRGRRRPVGPVRLVYFVFLAQLFGAAPSIWQQTMLAAAAVAAGQMDTPQNSQALNWVLQIHGCACTLQ